jgi:hypothetical protein
MREAYDNDPEKFKSKATIWAKQNMDKVRARNREWIKTRSDEYWIGHKIACLIRAHLKKRNANKSDKTISLLGCSIKQFRMHLEKQFTEGMNWSNHGEWHVDHIIPISWFDLTKPEQQKKAFHYTNCQPLWAFDNISKRDRYAG